MSFSSISLLLLSKLMCTFQQLNDTVSVNAYQITAVSCNGAFCLSGVNLKKKKKKRKKLHMQYEHKIGTFSVLRTIEQN